MSPINTVLSRICLSSPLCSATLSLIRGASCATYRFKSTSLAGAQIHNFTPASYGFISYYGYEEVIPAGTPLPHRRSIRLSTMFDYIHHDTFPVAYRHNSWDGFSELSRVTLTNIQCQPASITKLCATMEIDQTLRGTFHVRDRRTKSEASVQFDARVPPPEPLRLAVHAR